MINNLGISSYTLSPLSLLRRGAIRGPVYRPVRQAPVGAAVQIGGVGNDTINFGGTGPVGPPGPPGPPGTPGLVPVTVVTTTPFTATLAQYLLDVNVPGPSSIILPVSPVGTVFIVKDSSGSASTNTITITGLGALIDGSASATITANFGSVMLIFNGTVWSIV